MSSSKRILKNIFSLSVAEFATRGLSLIYTIYLARVLSPTGYGVYGFSKSLVWYFQIFVSLGYSLVGTREIAKRPDKMADYANAMVSIRLISAVILYILLFILTINLNRSLELKYCIMIAGGILYGEALNMNWVFQGIEKMEILAWRSVIIGLINTAAIFILVHKSGDTLQAVAVVTLSQLSTFLWIVYYYNTHFHKLKIKIEPALWKALFKVSFSVGISFIVVHLYYNLDTVMLGFMKSEFETGIYTAAHSILVVLQLPSTILQTAFFPQFSKTDSIEERGAMMKKYILILSFAGTFLSCFVFVFAPYLVSVLGAKYHNSILTLQILMVTLYMSTISVVFFTPMMAWNMEKLVVRANIAGLVINAIINSIFIPRYGVYGAATATIFSEIAVFTFIRIIFRRTNVSYSLTPMLKFGLIAVICFGPALYALNSGWNPILLMFLTSGTFFILTFVLKLITIEHIKGLIRK